MSQRGHDLHDFIVSPIQPFLSCHIEVDIYRVPVTQQKLDVTGHILMMYFPYRIYKIRAICVLIWKSPMSLWINSSKQKKNSALARIGFIFFLLMAYFDSSTLRSHKYISQKLHANVSIYLSTISWQPSCWVRNQFDNYGCKNIQSA